MTVDTGSSSSNGGKIDRRASLLQARSQRSSMPSLALASQAVTKWDSSISVINSILEPGSSSLQGLSDDQIAGLNDIRELLLMQGEDDDDQTAHIPTDLLRKVQEGGKQKKHHDVTERRTSQHIVAVYGGLETKSTKERLKTAFQATTFTTLLSSMSVRAQTVDIQGPFHESLSGISFGGHNNGESIARAEMRSPLPVTWHALPMEKRIELSQLLSWESLRKWDFDIFHIAELTDGHPLVFVSWAILASPYSQYWMQLSIQHDQASSSSSSSSHESSPTIDVEKMEGYHFLREFRIPPITLVAYLYTIEDDYKNDNPYHNSTHAADVTQSLHAMIQMTKTSADDDLESIDTFLDEIPSIQLFCILLAATVHDVHHPGTNNKYQIHARTDLALQYNDISVLENMHASHAFTRMLNDASNDINLHGDSRCNILHHASQSQIISIRKHTIEAVLHTDMSKHFASVSEIKGFLLSAESTAKADETTSQQQEQPTQRSIIEKTFQTMYKEHGWNLLLYMLHLADISNPAKARDIAIRWADCCLQEFFQQGDKEAKLGLAISPLCDRATTEKPQSQIGFLQFVVQPAFAVLGTAFPQIGSRISPIIERNLQFWEDEKDKSAGKS
mmetsp:Transcript_24572/g.68970  ORF Transcript_24572/g.68970 Transcript_24572/m.68970 type:complete len:618 (+) Transcript_24572:96-1949(+)